MAAGALTRIGREIVVLGNRYTRWLEKRSADVAGFECTAKPRGCAGIPDRCKAMSHNIESSDAASGAVPTPDYSQAAKHLALLSDEPVDVAKWIFQTFDDRKAKRKALTTTRYCTLGEAWWDLVALNIKGAGVFVTVNEMQAGVRGNKYFRRARAIFQEDDSGTASAPAAAAAFGRRVFAE